MPEPSGDTVPVGARLECVPRVAAASVVALGLCTLAGCWIAVPLATGAVPTLVPMRASIALFFTLAGVAAYLAAGPASEREHQVRSACAAVALVISLITLAYLLWGQDTNLGPALLPDLEGASAGLARILAVLGCVCLSVLAVALLTLDCALAENLTLGHLLALVAGAASFVGLLHCGLSAGSPGTALPVAVAAGMFLLSIGTALAVPRAGLAALLASDGPGGQVTRRLVPATLLSVAAAAGFHAATDRIVSPELASPLAFALAAVLVCVAIAWTATRLEREEAERHCAELDAARRIAIIEATSDFVCTAELNGRIVYLNPAVRRLAAIGDLDPLPALFLSDLCARSARAQIEGEALPSALRRREWRGETTFLGAGGAEIPVSAVVVAHGSPERGGTTFFSVIARARSVPPRASFPGAPRHAAV